MNQKKNFINAAVPWALCCYGVLRRLKGKENSADRLLIQNGGGNYVLGLKVKLAILRVEGRYLKNKKEETAYLHGFTYSYRPFFFNNNAWVIIRRVGMPSGIIRAGGDGIVVAG